MAAAQTQNSSLLDSAPAWANLAALFSKMSKIHAATTCARRAFQLAENDRNRIILG